MSYIKIIYGREKMNIKQLRYFLVVAQEHQITAAAKLLYTTQPPLSYQIKQLEKELGVSLFIRMPHGLELTNAGKSFYRYAQQIVNLAVNAEEELTRESKGTMGSIRLGVISSAGNIIPNNAVRKFTRYYPEINFQITDANTFSLINKLNNKLLDLAIVRTPFNMQGLMTKQLAEDRMVAVFNPQKFSLIQGELSLKEVSQQPLILYRRFESMFNESFAQNGLRPFYAVKCDDARTAIHWADRGMGVAIVPQSIGQDFSDQQLRMINYSRWNTQIMVVWRKDRALKPVVNKFIQAL